MNATSVTDPADTGCNRDPKPHEHRYVEARGRHGAHQRPTRELPKPYEEKHSVARLGSLPMSEGVQPT